MDDEQLRARIALLEELLTRALPVLRLTPYVKLAARVAAALGVDHDKRITAP